MKRILTIAFFLIAANHASFAQRNVPDYVEEALKANPVKAGTYRSYNFSEAKLKPASVIELDLNDQKLTLVPS